MTDEIIINIKNRQSVIFESRAFSLSSENEIGPFDVLPRHANFISLIKNKIIVHNRGVQDVEIPISTGILKVFENQVNIYLDVFGLLKV